MKLQLKKRKIKKLISDDKSFDNALTPNVAGGKEVDKTYTTARLERLSSTDGASTITQL